jgi:hypothetical protein
MHHCGAAGKRALFPPVHDRSRARRRGHPREALRLLLVEGLSRGGVERGDPEAFRAGEESL